MTQKKYAPPTTEDLTINIRRNGSGIGIHIDSYLKKDLDIEIGDKFAVEYKNINGKKGPKTIMLREVEK